MSLLDFLISPAAAQSAAPGAASPMPSFLFFAIVMAGMFFLMIWPQMRRQKQHREMLSKLAKGDEVITNGGIAGRVTKVDETYIGVEIAENVVISVQKNAVTAILPKGTLKTL